jgi:hypothetical protein
MPTYKISPRNSFTVNGRLFFVARTRYMDDGMQVFENKVKNLRPSLTTLEDLRPKPKQSAFSDFGSASSFPITLESSPAERWRAGW